MELRPLSPALGNASPMASLLGLGTVKLGRNRGVKYPAAFDLPTEEQTRDLLRTALDVGVTLLDTAPAYGTSEARLGELLGPDRDRFSIVTKVGESFDADTGSSFDFSPEAVRASVDQSLSRLRTDRVEAVLIHSDGRDEHILDTLGTVDALRDVQAEGKTRTVGMSCKTVAGARLAIDRCDVVMLTLNLEQREMLPMIRHAGERGVGVLVKKALMSGHAAGSSEPSPIETSLALSAAEAAVSSIVVGTASPANLRANAAIIEKLGRS